MTSAEPDRSAPSRGSPAEVFRVALGLGLTSFGGPVAHLGYFERTYVRRLGWLSAKDYAGLVALCQMLPGPASSQTGFLIGVRRAGWLGGLAAWLGFTLPSALALFVFALSASALTGPLAQAALHGLKLTAVCVVGQAVASMARSHCADTARAALAVAAAGLLLVVGGAGVQLAALALGALGGVVFCRGAGSSPTVTATGVGRRAGLTALVAFAGLLALAMALSGQGPGALAAICYRTGALVFGGGHVVLPLLHDALVPAGWLSESAFLSGYGAAQAVPGPLFAFAAYIGAAAAPGGAIGIAAGWAALALVAIFLPGLLLAAAGARLWSWIGVHPPAGAALAGVNAAVVGVLGAALYDPIWTSAVGGGRDVAIVAAGFVALERWRWPPLAVVVFCVAAAVVSGLLG